MEFFLFLLSIFIAAIFYLRLSKKIGGLELELSEELKSEIVSLIAEFNQSAERNITLIEEKVNVAKNVAYEIANQVAYMEKLKKTLEKEIKEAEIKLNSLLINSSSVVNKGAVKTIIAKTYEDIKNKTMILKAEENKVNHPIDGNNNAFSSLKDNGDVKDTLQQDINSDNKKEDEKNENFKPIIIQMFKNGDPIDKISEKTGFSKAEVELILKLESLI